MNGLAGSCVRQFLVFAFGKVWGSFFSVWRILSTGQDPRKGIHFLFVYDFLIYWFQPFCWFVLYWFLFTSFMPMFTGNPLLMNIGNPLLTIIGNPLADEHRQPQDEHQQPC